MQSFLKTIKSRSTYERCITFHEQNIRFENNVKSFQLNRKKLTNLTVTNTREQIFKKAKYFEKNKILLIVLERSAAEDDGVPSDLEISKKNMFLYLKNNNDNNSKV